MLKLVWIWTVGENTYFEGITVGSTKYWKSNNFSIFLFILIDEYYILLFHNENCYWQFEKVTFLFHFCVFVHDIFIFDESLDPT